MKCDFCYRHCDIKEGDTGYCRVRKNVNNKIISTSYGYLEAINIDSIEKKPLYHFLPGTKSLSIAQAGCNFRCDFCQNWQISQKGKSNNSIYIEPNELVNIALKHKLPSISFTYSEPIVWQDYVIDTSTIAKKHNIKTIMVTNGSFSKESREKLSPLIDAFNIDLKGNDEYYKKICKGDINSVLESIKYFIEKKNHVEVTTLLIESFHTKKILDNLAKILSDIKLQVWHLSKFHPSYKMNNVKATSENFLNEMVEIALNNNITYVYGGNTITPYPTICPNCNNILINNHYNQIEIKKDFLNNIKNNKCKYCNNIIYGTF